MGFQPTEWIYQHSRTEGSTRAVLLAIAWHADNDTWKAWPSVTQIAGMTHFSRATVFRSIADAAALDELDVTPGRGRGNPSHYQINPKRSQPETHNPTERSQPETLPPDKRSQKGLIHADKRSQSCDKNSQEPMNHANAPKRSQPETHNKRSQPETHSPPKPQTPTHCTTCQHPTWDCTCNQGPTIGPNAIRTTINDMHHHQSEESGHSSR